MMRLLHVYSGNLYGGIETILTSFARFEPDSPAVTHEFALCFEGRLSRELGALGAVVHHLGEAHWRRPHTVRRARRALRAVLSDRHDWVVCHAPWSYGLFGGVARRAGLPLALWIHDASGGRHWTERLARRTQPDLLVCNSRYTAGAARSWYPSAATTIVYAPIDVSPLTLSADERHRLRTELDTPDNTLVIAQASRMQRGKGHEVILEALAQIRERADFVWWVIGGAQRDAEARYAETVAASARRLGLADRVRWAGERHDVRRLFGAADLYCQANLTPESFGIASVEALSAGLPVIASASGGALEIVDDSCGVLVPPGDRDALAGALEGLIADRATLAALAARAPARAGHLCDPATQMLRLEQVMKDVRQPA